MNEPEPTNHWKSLAEQIGADVPDDLAAEPAPAPPESTSPGGRQPAEPARSVPASVPAAGRPAKRGPSASRKATDWGNLATDLGAASAAEPQDVTDEETPVTSAAADRDEPPPVLPAEPVTDLPAARRPAVKAEHEETAFLGQDSDLTAQGESEIDFGDSEATTAESSEREGRRRRRRPRRRSGRRQATDAAGAEPVEAAANGDKVEASESAEGDEPHAADLDDPDGQEDSTKPVGASHKNIPTWEESVGVIVDANIEARASRTRASRSGSGSSRGRGRGRGRKR
ncbi:MAG: hypothetical protein BMS9Abin04_202 [Planctomycetia bacterium]|nr:MAG: hypothetical protein BMS9Abin04_202 [Planctomycetia bacterium]